MRDDRDLYVRGAATLLASWEGYPRGSADAALTRLLKKSGRLDLNQRPFGPQPKGSAFALLLLCLLRHGSGL